MLEYVALSYLITMVMIASLHQYMHVDCIIVEW